MAQSHPWQDNKRANALVSPTACKICKGGAWTIEYVLVMECAGSEHQTNRSNHDQHVERAILQGPAVPSENDRCPTVAARPRTDRLLGPGRALSGTKSVESVGPASPSAEREVANGSFRTRNR